MGSSVAPSAVSRPDGADPVADAAPPSAALPSAALPMGTVLDGRYELTARIADGGGGTVYEGRDRLLRRRVAVKVRRDSELDHGERFEQEARLMAGLCHPGLVTVFDAGTDIGVSDTPQAYLVMEYVDGRTLAERIAEGPISPAEASRLGSQLASALAYVHSRGVVHRDVKPANVLLTCSPDGDGSDVPVAKLTDFGVARSIDGLGLTMHGHTVGTANYLSPEQATGAGTGPASDVYALGLLLLECLTGLIVFPGSGVATAAARLHGPVPIPSTVGAQWRELLTAMTAADPAARPTAAHVAATLARMSRTAAAPADATTVLPPVAAAVPVHAVARRPSRRRRRWALAALPGVAAATAAVWISLAAAPSVSSGLPSSVPVSPKPAAVSTQPAAAHPTSSAPVQQQVRHQPAQPAPKPPKPAKHGKGGPGGG